MTTPKKIFKSFLKPFFSSSNKGKNEEDLETIAAQEQKQFPFEVLVSATKDFHPDHKLGEGGFGPVFKGKLSDGRQIAVKKLSHCSRQGMKEFKNEAKLLARAQHRNVVNLLGYCVHGVEKLLVYEYVSNESLDKILFKSANRDALSWRQRQDIIVGIARGLFYLHEGSPTCIIHRDIKASNILLDDKWVPKIADFGMARFYPEDETHVNTHVAGTHGYMAPEYIRYGHLSVKTDVFSFGVVVLELISGQKNSTFNGDPDSRCLLEWADRIYKKGRSWEIMDPALAQSAIPDEIAMYIQIGLLCSQSDPRLRPTMQQVSVMLSKSPGSLDREPTRPGYPGSRIRSHRPGGGTSHTAGTSGASNPSTFSSSSISNTVSATASSSAPTPKEVSEVPQIDEVEAEVSIGNKIPDMNLSDEIPCEVSLNCCTNEEHFTSSAHFHEIDQHGLKEDQDKLVELKLLSLEFDDDHVLNNESSMTSKLDEIEEEKVPETPTSNDSFYQLHKKLLLLEKKDFGTESLDGSVVSELEGGDAVSSIEHLKSALKAERKALHALYTELEEERSASAVAANQTMAMINKLQEEKSAMQMEALQYQRMMEEQSEYDQEALQLLNELMVKREKEKQELEKELEVYRKRLSEYEAKEKAMRMLKRSKDGSVARSGLFSSASCSNGEDSEELSIDLNQEPKEDVNFYCHQECDDHDHKVQVDAFLELEESFVDFEEERMSILEQLKMLEEKLISMDDEDAKEFEDVRPMDDSYRENGDHTEENSRLDGEINEHANGFLSEMNGKLIINAKGKGLLPLFDAMSDENGDVMINGHENGFHSNGIDEENKKLDVEEELDLLHERLQALEADREFLKNCISSLKKGDKGMDLLHEILQHLRDLKNVDLRVRSSSNGLIL